VVTLKWLSAAAASVVAEEAQNAKNDKKPDDVFRVKKIAKTVCHDLSSIGIPHIFREVKLHSR
jgi:hypothetical protein